jgi:hypothetical protein
MLSPRRRGERGGNAEKGSSAFTAEALRRGGTLGLVRGTGPGVVGFMVFEGTESAEEQILRSL